MTLTAGDLARDDFERRLGESDQTDQLANSGGSARAVADAVDVERIGEDVGHRHSRIERGSRVLEDDRDRPPELLAHARRPGQSASAAKYHVARRRFLQSDHDFGQSGLAATRLAHDADRRPSSYGDTDIVDRVNRAGFEQ